MEKLTMEKIVTFCKNYGYIFQGSEIYGGLSNSWDYGPLGVLLKKNLQNCWWQRFITDTPDNVGVDCAILMNPRVWVATGHVGGFNDPLTDCRKCNSRFRADKLIEDFGCSVDASGMSNEELLAYLMENKVKCPQCGQVDYTPIKQFNMMYKTIQGVVDDPKNTVYMRPETAQGIFVNFKNIQRTMRKKVPFGVGQIGKVFRNEITPGNFIFRVREFEQMELEFFCHPGEELKWFDKLLEECRVFLKDIGIKEESLRERQHSAEELVFYSNATVDIEYKFPWGFAELWGVASRTDYDLKKHEEFSGVSLAYLDPETKEKFHPFVVEPSVSIERLLLATLFSCYEEEQLENDTREVLRLTPALAPYKVNVLPLIKKRHSERANEIYGMLSRHFSVSYDESQNIGKRYRRADAIGTPFCLTVDDVTIENNTVTVRHRDSMQQEVIEVDKLVDYISERIRF